MADRKKASDMKKFAFSQSLLLAVILSFVTVIIVSAQEETPLPSDDAVNEIAEKLYCPVCDDLPLDVCNSQACTQWKDLIRGKLAAGWTEEQIEDYFVLQYGEKVLVDPPSHGIYGLIYILPVVFLLAGVYILFRVFRRMHPQPNNNPTDTRINSHEDPYENRVEEALREKRR
jgi:cytochrome c-type biogenesis protein CcmH